MNALNILSGLSSTPPPSPPRSRASSSGNIGGGGRPSRAGSGGLSAATESKLDSQDGLDSLDEAVDEKTALLQCNNPEVTRDSAKHSGLWRLPRRLAHAILNSIKVVLTTIAAPGQYLVACFYNENNQFSASQPLRRLSRLVLNKRKAGTYAPGMRPAGFEDEGHSEKPKLKPKDGDSDIIKREESPPRSLSVDSAATAASDSEVDTATTTGLDDSPARNTRSKTASLQPASTVASPRRIRINDDSTKRHRRQRAAERAANFADSGKSQEDNVTAVANSLKSPSSPSALKLKYPRAPAPPRPLVPKRQPSYVMSANTDTPRKTLIIDLDETLIHSMAKGGRMSTGHMVEVKLQGTVLGSQVPILYYVHERPYCHDFLRKVCKWYNLIVFTASVQEYADPVIDWLERERKYFSGRYYRQHCTFRNGAYIKDLSQVEPDLSRVMILDNSPMSYIFHEDNAIPIEGWISDPTDNDLLHLIPLLEGLQYVTDVRALLALRLGQAERT